MTGEAVRPARPEDATKIAEYHHESFVEAFAARPELIAVAEPDIELFEERLTPGSGFTTMVLVDEADAAVGHVMVNGDLLVHLFVAGRFQRSGHGRRMLDIGEDMIRAAGHAAAELHVRVGNERAIALYKSADWTMTDELVDDPLPDGSTQPEHVMRKRLVS